MYHRRVAEPDETADLYRSCLQQLGADSPECQNLLEENVPDPAQQFAVRPGLRVEKKSALACR